jgi:hypothetical protein
MRALFEAQSSFGVFFLANLHRKGTLQGHCTAAVTHALNKGWLAGWLAGVTLKLELFSRN